MQHTSLKDLGFDEWFREKQEEFQKPEHRPARVTAVDRDRYLVMNENSEVPAEIAGRLMFFIDSSTDLSCVGDWTLVQYHNDDTLAIIHALFPRKSVLRLKSAGRKSSIS